MNSPPRGYTPSFDFGQVIVAALHLSKHDGKVHHDNLAQELAIDWSSWREDSATGTKDVFTSILSGNGWRHAAAMLQRHQGSCGSQAAVRAIPAGLLPMPMASIADAARDIASITHSHPLAGDGASIVAAAISLATRDLPTVNVPAGRYLAMTATTAGAQFRAVLPMVRMLVDHRAGPAEAAATLRQGRTTLRTVPAALTAFLCHPNDPAAAIRYALLMAGPNRAIAIMTAALVGARCPHTALPHTWMPYAALRQRVRVAANALARLAPQPGAARQELVAHRAQRT
jgi:poly(ADP-ribose) glycohydrolase ARH3